MQCRSAYQLLMHMNRCIIATYLFVLLYYVIKTISQWKNLSKTHLSRKYSLQFSVGFCRNLLLSIYWSIIQYSHSCGIGTAATVAVQRTEALDINSKQYLHYSTANGNILCKSQFSVSLYNQD